MQSSLRSQPGYALGTADPADTDVGIIRISYYSARKHIAIEGTYPPPPTPRSARKHIALEGTNLPLHPKQRCAVIGTGRPTDADCATISIAKARI